MPGIWIGEPFDCNGRECREDAGLWFWFQARCSMWQEQDEFGNEMGPPQEKLFDWVNTGEPCEP